MLKCDPWGETIEAVSVTDVDIVTQTLALTWTLTLTYQTVVTSFSLMDVRATYVRDDTNGQVTL